MGYWYILQWTSVLKETKDVCIIYLKMIDVAYRILMPLNILAYTLYSLYSKKKVRDPNRIKVWQ